MNVHPAPLKRPKKEIIVNQFRLLPTTTPSSLLISSHILLYPLTGHFSTVRQLNTVGYYPPNPSYMPDSSKSKPVRTKTCDKNRSSDCSIGIYEINLSLCLEIQFHVFLILTMCYCDPTFKDKERLWRKTGGVQSKAISVPPNKFNQPVQPS